MTPSTPPAGSAQGSDSGLHVVLLEPEIPWNTGNIGRSCVGTGTTLHLVGRLGFRVEEKEIRRSGLDYWPKLKWRRHKDWERFLETVPAGAELIFFSARGEKTYWDAPYKKGCYLIFGGESSGFPPLIRERYADKMVRIPISGDIRSLNLSTSAGVALFEAIRQTRSAEVPA